MRAYTTPGVYFEWLDAAAGAIRIVRTDVAGFVGFAERGPLHAPVRIESWTQFRSTFGMHMSVAYLAYAVEGFFANGGQICYVVRVADPDGAQPAHLDVGLPDGRVLRLTASTPGRWANALQATFTRGRSDRATLILRLPSGEQEQWRDVAFDEDDERFAVRILNGDSDERGDTRDRPVASGLVRAWIGPVRAPAMNRMELDRATQTGWLAHGEDGLWTLRVEHLSGYGAPANVSWGLAALEKVPEVSIVAMPDAMPQFVAPVRRRNPPWRDCRVTSPPPIPPPPEPDPDPDAPPVFSRDEIKHLQRQLVAHCDQLRDRVAILDARLEDGSPLAAAAWAGEFSSKYAALYYPWLRVAEPDHVQAVSRLRNVPPSGHLAGVFARVEREAGVHKPPANELIEGATDVTVETDDISHGFLNEQRINVIRTFPGRGIRVAGARTLSAESEWRYVNVRRLLLMIERSLDRSTQWLVFEPNSEGLWRDVDRVLRSFFEDLWRRGMLDGATAEQAYDVACDKQTMSDDDIERGHLIATIGVQPPWPAEFIVARIGRTESGLQILEGQGDEGAAVRRA